MASVRLRGVRKIYPGGVAAVQGIDLDIADREFIVLVGPSGCGKSTTLRMIAGLETLSSGEIHIGDRLVNDISPSERDIAMVFQNYALYPHMTVYKNLAFGLRLRKLPKTEIERRVREAAEILGITELLGRRPKALSGGQRQRVAVGRAIVRHPGVFLFDEPLSNLDAKLRVQMRTEIIKLHQRLQNTMIYVTHDQIEAMTMGDRIVVMRDGVIQQVDTPIALYRRPANRFVASFIGSPPMNLIEGHLTGPSESPHFSAGERLNLEVPAPYRDALAPFLNQKIVCGIRPEDLMWPVPPQQPPALHVPVEIVEPMGAETYLHLRIGNTTAIARTHAETLPKIGETLPLAFRPDRLHFFHPTSGERVAIH